MEGINMFLQFKTCTTLCFILRGVLLCHAKIPIFIGGFYSVGDNWDGGGIVPAIELALDHVNNKTDVLEDYELQVLWKNSMCKSAGGVWTFYEHLLEEPRKIMLLGPACSTDTQPIAETAHNANLVTISYAAASPVLSDRERYPFFFRTYMPEDFLNREKIWLLKEFDWMRLGTFNYNHELFTLTNDDFIENLPSNIKVEVSELIIDEPRNDQLQKMKERDLRVFIANMYENTARTLFCKIYQQRMYGKGYVWILPGWYSDQWWRTETNVGECSIKELETAVVESMYISFEASNFTTTPNVTLVSGIRGRYFTDMYELKKRESNDSLITSSDLDGFGYDALWASALALDRSAKILANTGRRLEEFDYNDPGIGNVILEAMKTTNFTGVTGDVSFTSGDRQGAIRIEQLQGSCREGEIFFLFHCYKFNNESMDWNRARQHCKELANDKDSYLVSINSMEELDFLSSQVDSKEWLIGLTYDDELDQLVWVDTDSNDPPIWTPSTFQKKENPCFIWNFNTGEWNPIDCNSPKPFICKLRPDFAERLILTISSNNEQIWHSNFSWLDDEIPKDRTPAVQVGLSATAYVFICLFACLGILMALCFLMFNILARKQKFVKLSSPRLNNLVVAGCILIYLSICILGLDIRRNNQEEPSQAFCMLRVWLISPGFVLGYGALFSKTWRVYKIATSQDKQLRRKTIKDCKLFVMVGVLLLVDLTILVVWQAVDPLKLTRTNLDFGHYLHVCTCQYNIIWSTILLAYKGLILFFGVFLAWQTRTVEIPALNDSKLIGICVYNTTVLSVFGVSVSVAFPENPSPQHVITSSIMTLCATFTLIIIFVPKIVFVYKFPNADRRASTTLSSNAPRPVSVVSETDNSTRQSVEEDQNQGDRLQNLKQHLENLAGFNRRIYLRRRNSQAQQSNIGTKDPVTKVPKSDSVVSETWDVARQSMEEQDLSIETDQNLRDHRGNLAGVNGRIHQYHEQNSHQSKTDDPVTKSACLVLETGDFERPSIEGDQDLSEDRPQNLRIQLENIVEKILTGE